jgi:hypothetical protein
VLRAANKDDKISPFSSRARPKMVTRDAISYENESGRGTYAFISGGREFDAILHADEYLGDLVESARQIDRR